MREPEFIEIAVGDIVAHNYLRYEITEIWADGVAHSRLTSDDQLRLQHSYTITIAPVRETAALLATVIKSSIPADAIRWSKP